MHRRTFLGAAASLATVGCLGDNDDAEATVLGETLTLATTTSTHDTGLLDELHAPFEERYGASVHAIAQGTGAALETGRAGDADVVMVHARSLEDDFLRAGHGINRRDLMYNDFVVVGPTDDPAGVDGTDEVTAAFRAIAESEAVFVSRGDESGTHTKERAIWEAAEIEPEEDWYREAGDGMGAVLNQANEASGYTLADRGTFLAQRAELDIDIRLEGPIEGGPSLLANAYGLVVVNPALHETVEYDLAMAYVGFVTSPEGQRLIGAYTVDGEQLFVPDAVSEDPRFEQYVPGGWAPQGEST